MAVMYEHVTKQPSPVESHTIGNADYLVFFFPILSACFTIESKETLMHKYLKHVYENQIVKKSYSHGGISEKPSTVTLAPIPFVVLPYLDCQKNKMCKIRNANFY